MGWAFRRCRAPVLAGAPSPAPSSGASATLLLQLLVLVCAGSLLRAQLAWGLGSLRCG